MKKFLSGLPFFSLFNEIVTTSTFRQSSITFIGTVVNGALGAIFYIITARLLGPVSFGLMSVALVTQSLVTDLGDLGTGTGLINFVSRYFQSDREKAFKFLKLTFEIITIVSFIVIVFGLFTAGFVTRQLFARPELEILLKIALLGVLTLLYFSFITKTLQAMQKFWSWSLIQIATNTLRLILVFCLIFIGYLSIGNVLWIYTLMPFVGFVIGIFLITPRFLNVKNEFSVAKELFTYNKWVFAFTILATISSRLDTFISARLLNSFDLGTYSAANQMVKIMPMLVSAIGTVIAPKMASLNTVGKLITYLKKTQTLVLGLALLGLATLPIALWLIPLLLGSEYGNVGSVFVILFIAMLSFLISVPVHMSVFYYFSYPKLFFWLSALHLLVIAILGWFLTLAYGAMGAASAVLIGQMINFIIPLIWVLRKIQRSRT